MSCALVAVSGGSDSLALLDMLRNKNEYNLIVCHVNYNYRESALNDENIVKRYCQNYGIKLYILSLDSHKEKEGNFEDWARVKRYKFFKEICIKENCDCLFLGHQEDDLIETYLLQKKRNAIVEYYGLKKETEIQGMKVIRPLLDFSKKELEEYCNDNGIEFGVDETNFDLKYSRNKVRHEVVNTLNKEERKKIIEEINKLNIDNEKRVEEVKKLKKECLIESNKLDLIKFNKLNLNLKKEVLYYFVIDNVYKRISIKENRILDMLKKIDSDKPNILLATYDELNLFKEYDLLVFEKNNNDYCYVIEDSFYGDLGEFIVSGKGKKLERVLIKKDDFPLYIKNYDGSNREINRIFINKKIPLRKRKKWPVITDKFGRLLLVINIKKFYNDISDFDDNFIELYVSEK